MLMEEIDTGLQVHLRCPDGQVQGPALPQGRSPAPHSVSLVPPCSSGINHSRPGSTSHSPFPPPLHCFSVFQYLRYIYYMFSSVCVYMCACMCLYICGAQRSPVDTISWELPLLRFELGLSLELGAHLFS